MLIEGRHELATDRMLFLHATAKWDDEPTTPEEEALVQEARDEIAAGHVYTHEEARRLLVGDS